jgi:magnesium-transporting ATPase (P-type)
MFPTGKLKYLSIFLILIFPSTVFAANNPGPAGILQLQQLIVRIIGLIGEVAFIVLTIMLVVAGFKYITSEGDQKKLQQAHDTTTWAILGIVFLVIGWLVLRLIEAYTGLPFLSNFCLGFPGASTACP